jgi:hypothetical protein
MRIILDGDNAWPDLVGKRVHHIGGGGEIQVAGLEGGMQSGLPSVTIRIDLPNGEVVLAETSMRLFLNAAKAFMARYGDVTAV